MINVSLNCYFLFSDQNIGKATVIYTQITAIHRQGIRRANFSTTLSSLLHVGTNYCIDKRRRSEREGERDVHSSSEGVLI